MKQVAIAGLVVALMSGSALAHGQKKHNEAKAEPAEIVTTEFGTTGDPKTVGKSVAMIMSDEMRFSPNTLKINAGDTVRFVIRNSGEILHEMVLGRSEDLVRHAKLMAEFPEMEHDEPYMAHVEPGAEGEIVWTFSKAGQFEFGCLIPGHYEGGMKGTIIVH